MPKKSAGILMYRQRQGKLQVLLAHPGGPFWKNKDAGAWTIPKGEIGDEDPLAAAQREFFEETGFEVAGDFIPLTAITQKNGKLVQAWAVQGDLDETQVKSNEFELQWPPGSGRRMMVPEVDRAEWFGVDEAVKRINPAQAALVRELQNKLENSK
jgi:predicted NUDIX family NTP pyrophosphohydrolase